MSTETKSKKHFIVIRVVDYRLQAVSMDGGNVNWEDIGPETWVTDDGEEAFQVARANRGLKLSANGLPSAKRMKGYHECLAGLIAAAASASARKDAELEEPEQGGLDEDGVPAHGGPY